MRRTATLILCIATFFCVFPFNAQAQSNITLPWNRRRIVENENRKKDAIIDSLKTLIEEYEARIALESEAREELIDIYYENQGKIGAGLTPADYTDQITDSLLSIWYLQSRANNNHEGEDYDMEFEHFTSNVPNEVYMERLSKMNSYITLPYNETVKNYMILYSEKMPTKMSQMLGLATYYMPIFEETFDRYGLPEELKYMAVIESALNPTALSRAGAAGMWQFMRTTGKSYGLEINSYVDERLDVEKAADAAARYLQDAYGIFGDWNLAISSYNCGAGNVNKAIRRSGSREFWKLYDYLPRETRGYVPAFVGAMYAFKYYKEHGLVPAECSLPAHVDTFQINKMLHFQQVTDMVGVDIETIRNLNPQYKHDIIPGNEKTYILRLPYSYTAAFIEKEDTLYKHKADQLFNQAILQNIQTTGSASTDRIVYKVKSGDYLGRIAARYHVSVNDIRNWNHLRSNSIRVGQNLIIYQKSNKPAPQPTPAQKANEEKLSAIQKSETPPADTISKVPADTSMMVLTDTTSVVSAANNTPESGQESPEEPQPEETTYVVKSGDTLFGISKKFPGVTAQEIMDLNKVGSNIRPGMKLRIPVKK